MSLTKILRNAVSSAAILTGAYTANAQTPKVVVPDELYAWTALPLQGVSVDATKVRAVGNGTTYNYDLGLTTGATNINSGNVTDLATGLSANTQTAQQFGTGGISLYNNAVPTGDVANYSGPANSLGVGGPVKAVVGKGKNATTTTYQSFLDNNGVFKLLNYPTSSAATTWTLPDKTGVSGLDTILRAGGNENSLADYLVFVPKTDGTFTVRKGDTGSVLGTYVIDGLASVGMLTDIAVDRQTGNAYASVSMHDGSGSIIKMSSFAPEFAALSIPPKKGGKK